MSVLKKCNTAARIKGAVFFVTAIGCVLLSATAAAESEGAVACTAVGKLVPFCGLPHPEDMELLPDGKTVLVSEMHIQRVNNRIQGLPGTLKTLNPETGDIEVVYPSPLAPAGKALWGDPDCGGEIGADLMAHGIHLSQRRDGAWQLLAVNHNTRESIEFFELIQRQNTWTLSWRGCAIPPPPNRLNDVAGLPDGGFITTTMHRMGDVDYKKAKALAQQGKSTGLLWRWSPGQGFSEQAGSEAPKPNGVQVDKAGRYAYLNSDADGGEVRKLDLRSGAIVARVNTPHPDNSSWTERGTLLVTGMAPDADSSRCFQNPQVPCLNAFAVYEIDPASMQATLLFSHAGAPMGAGTVAIQVADDLLVGSFVGDRVLSVKGLLRESGKHPLDSSTAPAPPKHE